MYIVFSVISIFSIFVKSKDELIDYFNVSKEEIAQINENIIFNSKYETLFDDEAVFLFKANDDEEPYFILGIDDDFEMHLVTFYDETSANRLAKSLTKHKTYDEENFKYKVYNHIYDNADYPPYIKTFNENDELVNYFEPDQYDAFIENYDEATKGIAYIYYLFYKEEMPELDF